MLVRGVGERRWLLGQLPGDRVRTQQERRIGRVEPAEPGDQRVAVRGPLIPPLGHGDPSWLALVPRPLGVVAQLRSADEGRVREALREDAAARRWPVTAVGIPPAMGLGEHQEPDTGQPGRRQAGGAGADLPPAVTLPDLGLTRPLAPLVADHQRRVHEHHRIPGTGRRAGPGDSVLDATHPARVQDPAAGVDHRHARLVSGKTGAAFPPRQVHAQIPSRRHPRVLPHRPLPGKGVAPANVTANAGR